MMLQRNQVIDAILREDAPEAKLQQLLSERGLTYGLVDDEGNLYKPDMVQAADQADIDLFVEASIALSILEPKEPSHDWNLASQLEELGRHLEAVPHLLEASRRFQESAREQSGPTGDEEDWAHTALWRAARILLEEQPLAAAAIVLRLHGPDREELEEALRRGVRPTSPS